MKEDKLFGIIPIKVDPDMPPDQIRFVDPRTDRCIAMIVNVPPTLSPSALAEIEK